MQPLVNLLQVVCLYPILCHKSSFGVMSSQNREPNTPVGGFDSKSKVVGGDRHPRTTHAPLLRHSICSLK